MSCQQVRTTPAFNPYPRSVQVGEFEVAIDGGIWVAVRDIGGDRPAKHLVVGHRRNANLQSNQVNPRRLST